MPEACSGNMDAPDKGIPERSAVITPSALWCPHLIKAGFIFGGSTTRRRQLPHRDWWSAHAFVSVAAEAGTADRAEGGDLVMLS